MKQTISILGCGWLGKPLAIDFIQNNYVVKGSTTREQKITELSSYNIEPHTINIDNLTQKINVFLESDIIIIAITSKNIEGFKNLISYIETSTIQHVIFISSTSVYPNCNAIVHEDMDLEPSPLLEIEYLFRNNSHFSSTIIRFSGLFGYDRKPGNFFKNRAIPNPDGVVNMIHRDDCIAIINEVINQNAWNKTYNASSAHNPSRKDFYTKAAQQIGLPAPTFTIDNSIAYKTVSNQKLVNELNYNFKHFNILDALLIE